MVRTSDHLRGFEAWRRLIGFIAHGKDMQLESKRTEMRTVHFKLIKNLESVPIGIAQFEFQIQGVRLPGLLGVHRE